MVWNIELNFEIKRYILVNKIYRIKSLLLRNYKI